MCSECMTTPCNSMCPNAPEPKSYGVCKYCGDKVIEGDEAAEINGDLYHLECLECYSTKELLKMLNVDVGEIKDNGGELYVSNS